MEKTNDNARTDDRDDDVVVLGAISIETKGLAGTGEPVGRPILSGIAED